MPLIPNEIEMYLAEDSNPGPRRNKKKTEKTAATESDSDFDLGPKHFSAETIFFLSAKLRKIKISR